MSARPTSRSGYSEHNHYEESQAWHCQQPAFHQAPGQPIPKQGLQDPGMPARRGGRDSGASGQPPTRSQSSTLVTDSLGGLG